MGDQTFAIVGPLGQLSYKLNTIKRTRVANPRQQPLVIVELRL
ncbi:MAG TPA: hypothetical protein VIG72_15035 [Pontibacter sp.]